MSQTRTTNRDAAALKLPQHWWDGDFVEVLQLARNPDWQIRAFARGVLEDYRRDLAKIVRRLDRLKLA